MLNQVIVSSACCCLQMCCKEVSQTAFKIVGRVAFVKMMYCLVYCTFLIAVYLSMYLLRQWEFFMKVFADSIDCLSLTNQFDCVSASVVYRMALSLAVFSILMLTLMAFCSARLACILNQGLFFTKLVVLLLLFLAALRLDDSVLMTFSSICQFFSYVFILWQVVIIIDLAYLWGISWAQRYSSGSQLFACLLIACTICNYILAFGVNIFGYTLSARTACQNYPNILCTIFLVGLFGIQLLNYNKQNSLLATSALSLFISYWTISAVYSGRDCNHSLVENQQNINKSIFLKINIPLSIFFVVLASFGSILGSSNQEDPKPIAIELQESIHQSDPVQRQDEEEMVKERRLWVRWHVYAVAMSLYIGMVLTDWGSGDILHGKFQLTASAEISKVFTAVATFLLYAWTLLAPRLFPSRNFYFQ